MATSIYEPSHRREILTIGVEWLLHNLFQSFAYLVIPWPYFNAQSVLDIEVVLLEQRREYCRTNNYNYRRNYGGAM
jgi:hypothetical protein